MLDAGDVFDTSRHSNPPAIPVRVTVPLRSLQHLEMVRVEGLEPPRLAAPEPKSGASTNFATPASDLLFSKLSRGMREKMQQPRGRRGRGL